MSKLTKKEADKRHEKVASAIAVLTMSKSHIDPTLSDNERVASECVETALLALQSQRATYLKLCT